MMGGKKGTKLLFGGEKEWDAQEWTASDDRVRGGKSKSHLDCNAEKAVFYGNLDIKTLGGAGFASQRTTSDIEVWDLHSYDGIELQLDIPDSDQKRYTFIFKDQLLRANPESGREQSTLSWEVDFTVPQQEFSGKTVSVYFGWKDFHPTYRGKRQTPKDGPELRSIKRFSIMMRSFFGTQDGNFRLTILSIRATSVPTEGSTASRTSLSKQPIGDTLGSTESLDKSIQAPNAGGMNSMSLWYWLLGKCGKL